MMLKTIQAAEKATRSKKVVVKKMVLGDYLHFDRVRISLITALQAWRHLLCVFDLHP